jgi:hypothetical protein
MRSWVCVEFVRKVGRALSIPAHLTVPYPSARSSVNNLAAPSIPRCPKWTMRANLSLWVIASLFVRTAHDAIGHDHRLRAMGADEFKDCFANRPIEADVTFRGEPSLKRHRFLVLPWRAVPAPGHGCAHLSRACPRSRGAWAQWSCSVRVGSSPNLQTSVVWLIQFRPLLKWLGCASVAPQRGQRFGSGHTGKSGCAIHTVQLPHPL